jgi:hypothetical protein
MGGFQVRSVPECPEVDDPEPVSPVNTPYLDQFIPAKQLKSGTHLRTPDGQSAIVVGGSVPAVHDGWMWDLTVPGNNDHDFYVVVSSAAVLVHNENQCGVEFDPQQLQKKFKHASDFGVSGNYNLANRQVFQDALEGHLDDPGTSPIQGTYRGDPVTRYFNPGTGLNVIGNPAGEFVSGWRLGVAQITNILTHGGLN